MLRTIRGHLTYSNVTASVALFIALGGVSYAAATLPSNSVGSSQITQDAVSGSKVENSSLTGVDIKNKSLTAADFDGSVQGSTAPLLTTLAPGTTLRGTFGMYGHGEVNNGFEAASESVSFPIPLASAPSAKVVQNGTASAPPECPGTAAAPQAAPG